MTIIGGTVAGVHVAALAFLTGLPSSRSEPPRPHAFQMVELAPETPTASPAAAPVVIPAPAEPEPAPLPPPPPTPLRVAEATERAPAPKPKPRPKPPARPVVRPSAPETPPTAPPGEPAFEPAVFSAAHLANPPPAYPAWARRQGIEGIVVLRVAVQPDGGAAGVEVARSCGHPRLDGIAAEAVRNWRFAPARRGAQAVASVVEVPIRFSLTDRERKS